MPRRNILLPAAPENRRQGGEFPKESIDASENRLLLYGCYVIIIVSNYQRHPVWLSAREKGGTAYAK